MSSPTNNILHATLPEPYTPACPHCAHVGWDTVYRDGGTTYLTCSACGKVSRVDTAKIEKGARV